MCRYVYCLLTVICLAVVEQGYNETRGWPQRLSCDEPHVAAVGGKIARQNVCIGMRCAGDDRRQRAEDRGQRKSPMPR